MVLVCGNMNIANAIFEYAARINWMEACGLFFGLACVILLIKQNIWTWPTGILYVLISFVIFFQAKLYADLILHVFFLILNIYGWYHWLFGKPDSAGELPVGTTGRPMNLLLLTSSAIGVLISGWLLATFTDASLPYWDSATSVLSLIGMWLTAKKKIENWYYWIAVDVLATGIYFYKEIYFYSLLYFIYCGLAISGYYAWKKSMEPSLSTRL